MAVQFIHDTQGNMTGVFIPIEEWNLFTGKHPELLQNDSELPQWQKDLLAKRLNDYYKNAEDVEDFDEMVNEIEKSL